MQALRTGGGIVFYSGLGRSVFRLAAPRHFEFGGDLLPSNTLISEGLTKKVEEILVKPIGYVCCTVEDEQIARTRRTIKSDILIEEEYAEGLLGISEYSHLIVLFWMHRVGPNPSLLAHPRGKHNIPEVGAFASRGRNHPNPIGLAVVDLVSISGRVLTVRRLDAYDGTPVIDIKPYDNYDAYTDIKVPQWFRQRALGGE